MIRLLCLLAFFIPLSAFSQVKLNGKVAENDGSPVSYATIQLLSNDSVSVKSDITREDGSFELAVKPGNYILRVAQFGKAIYIKNLLLNGDQNLGLITVNMINTLAMVNISANKPIIRQEFDKFIFNVENSPLKNGYNGLEVLARAPKLQVNAAGEVLLRNSSPLIMINGRKQNLTGEELSGYLAGLNAEMIKSIEIQSLGSANADALAKGGVVNIILKKAPVGFSSTLTSSYTYRKGNIWSGYTGLNNNYGGDKWNFYSKIGYRRDNDYGNFKTTKDFIWTGGSNLAIGSFRGLRKNLNILGGLVFYPDEKQEFGAEFYFSKGNGNYGTAENLVVGDAVINTISDNFRRDLSEANVWYTTLNYTLKTDTLSTIKFIVDVGRNDITKTNTTDTRYTFGNLPANLTNYLIQPLSDYYTLQADWHQRVSKAWSLNAGLKYSSVRRNNTLQTRVLQDSVLVLISADQEDFYNKENISAGYFSVSAKPDERNSFKLGFRTESTAFSGENRITDQTAKQNYTGFFPSMYYGYAIEKEKILSFNYSRSIQRPSFNDLNPFIRKENDYSYILGNPHLKPQYTGIKLPVRRPVLLHLW
jgi:iron complex outermembrane receptor protein